MKIVSFCYCVYAIHGISLHLQKQTNTMKYYKAIITETTASNFGQVIANTKSPSKFNGMTLEQFTEATKYISVFTIKIIEL